MTWILPKQLHTLASALDTEALISDLNEQSQICAQSLFLRSKPSPAPIWSRKWKRDSWTQHLSGRILRPSLGLAFAERLASSLEATLASPSAPPANDSEQTTRDISGRSSQLELLPCDPDSASLKTSRGTFLWDSSKSYETFKDLVIAARSEYSARLKLARRISESGSSSWPTIRASEYKDTGPVGSKSHSHMLAKGYLCAVVTAGHRDRAKNSSEESHREPSQSKLNPRWVETLMGLPVGWTMPSCASPVTPEWTSSDCSETASCQQQPSEPLTY